MSDKERYRIITQLVENINSYPESVRILIGSQILKEVSIDEFTESSDGCRVRIDNLSNNLLALISETLIEADTVLH